MKRHAFILAATLLVAAAGGAGGKKQIGKESGQMSEEQCAAMRASMVDKKLGMLTQDLALTKAQQGKVKTILTEEMAKKCPHSDKAAAKSEPNDMDAMKARVREVLTPEQQAKFDKMGGLKNDAMAGHTKGEKGAACCPH